MSSLASLTAHITIMKKPVQNTTGDGKGAVKKRPASATVKISEQGAGTPKKRPASALPEKPSEPTRDKEASRAFTRLLKAGQVPEQVKKIWESLSLRADKTNFINDVVTSSSTSSGGRLSWGIKEDAPILKEFAEKYTNKYAKLRKKALPRSVMSAKFRSEADFQQAISDGDIIKLVDEHGHEMYCYKAVEIGELSGVRSGQNASTISALEIL